MRTFLFLFLFLFLISSPPSFADPGEKQIEIFQLQHRDPDKIIPVFDHIKSEDGKVTIDRHTRSIIVVDYRTNLDQMAKTLKLLDVKQKQVDIEVLIVEVSSATFSQIGMLSGLSIIPPDKFNDILFLINNDSDSNIRSTMKIKTLSGQPARIQATQEQIYGGTITARENVVILSPVSTRSAGDQLEVLPWVNNDRTITLKVQPSKSKFTGDITKEEQSILTQVILRSGDTIVLGGIDTVEQQTKQRGIPLVGVQAPLENINETRKILMFLSASISND